MELTAGLGSVDDYIRYIEAGADECFCGYIPYAWDRKYGTVLSLNRREVRCCSVQLGACLLYTSVPLADILLFCIIAGGDLPQAADILTAGKFKEQSLFRSLERDGRTDGVYHVVVLE